tara:strand:- start:1008 stop:1190 length:183 start_codon:yes stop_codon:yes gene_type:complete
MATKKKLWTKPTQVIEVGQCKHCNKIVTNDMSFLAFADKTHSHFNCDRKNYYKQLIKKDK